MKNAENGDKFYMQTEGFFAPGNYLDKDGVLRPSLVFVQAELAPIDSLYQECVARIKTKNYVECEYL